MDLLSRFTTFITQALIQTKPGPSKIFPQQSVESFHREVRDLLKFELQGLDPAAILKVKSLIKAGLNDKNDFDAINLRESYGKI